MTEPHERGRVLVVEDELDVAAMLQEWLIEAGYQVDTAGDGKEAIRMFFERRPNLVIADILMPNMDGLELCQRIREVSRVPIIILSALGQEKHKVTGLEIGADDYLAKPVGQRELVARVTAVLRRAATPALADEPGVYEDGDLAINHKTREVFVRGDKVDLTPLEYRLLTYLVSNADHVLTHDQILDRVWGIGYDTSDLVKWHVSRLRKKLEREAGTPQLIVTVRGAGYRYKKPNSV